MAMGIQGTEVAQGASDMILTDDNFSTIVTAIHKGRVIYSNIQRFVAYLLGTNVGQVLVVFTAVVAGLPMPLQPLSILVLNLAVDSVPAMTMALEVGDAGTMQRPPRPRTEPIIFGRMWASIGAHSAATALAVVGSFVLGLHLNLGSIFADEVLADNGSAAGGACDRWDADAGWVASDEPDCTRVGLARARALAFISISVAEVMRAFSVRQNAPFYHQPFRNAALNGGVACAAGVVLAALLIPGAKFARRCAANAINPHRLCATPCRRTTPVWAGRHSGLPVGHRHRAGPRPAGRRGVAQSAVQGGRRDLAALEQHGVRLYCRPHRAAQHAAARLVARIPTPRASLAARRGSRSPRLLRITLALYAAQIRDHEPLPRSPFTAGEKGLRRQAARASARRGHDSPPVGVAAERGGHESPAPGGPIGPRIRLPPVGK